jgi:hypothetical protein
MCPGTTAYRRHTKDQTDREEHCSTLVDLRLHFAKISFPSFGIRLYLYLYSAQAQEAYMFHLVGFDTRNSRCGAAMVWCGVMCLQDGTS